MEGGGFGDWFLSPRSSEYVNNRVADGALFSLHGLPILHASPDDLSGEGVGPSARFLLRSAAGD